MAMRVCIDKRRRPRLVCPCGQLATTTVCRGKWPFEQVGPAVCEPCSLLAVRELQRAEDAEDGPFKGRTIIVGFEITR